MDQLRAQIKKLQRQNASQRWFIPDSILRSVMSEVALRASLLDTEIPSHQREETLSHIFPHGVKIYGILVVLRIPSQISKFIKKGRLDDAELPLNQPTLVQDIGLPEENAIDFLKIQWEYLAPLFYYSTRNRYLDENAPLPFASERYIADGAFGYIYETTLDPDHQTEDGFLRKFVRKEFKIRFQGAADRASLSHQKELKNMSLLNSIQHPNIIKLLGSYTHDGKHSLLFPLAENGSLENLFTNEERPRKLESDESIIIALAAVSSAIENVHDFSERKLELELLGCHHDLRPRNILVSDGTFILSDFGLSTFKEQGQNSETPYRLGSDDHIAPECVQWEDGEKPGKLYRSTDIWSFGCIIIQVVTYMVRGTEGVKDLTKARRHRFGPETVHYFHHKGKGLCAGVSDWLSMLETTSPDACGLLVQLAHMMLDMDHSRRPKAKDVTAYLRMVALFAVGETVHGLFKRLQELDCSSDAFLEHKRFDAWRKSMGIANRNEVKEFKHRSRVTLQYESMLACLLQLRDDLEARLSKDRDDPPHMNISVGVKLNDELYQMLSPGQLESYRDYFHILVMEDPNSSKLLESQDTGPFLMVSTGALAQFEERVVIPLRNHLV